MSISNTADYFILYRCSAVYNENEKMKEGLVSQAQPLVSKATSLIKENDSIFILRGGGNQTELFFCTNIAREYLLTAYI